MGERLERVGKRGLALRLRLVRQEEGDGDEADRHQRGGAVEGIAPRHVAERGAEQGAERDAEAERRLVEQDGEIAAAAGRGDDDRQRGGDEQRIAEAPAGAEGDQLRESSWRCPTGRRRRR